MKARIFIAATILFLMACNSSSPSSAAKSKADSLREEVLNLHNEAMAKKMTRLEDAEKKVQELIDSIQKLSPAMQQEKARYKFLLDSVLQRLKYADYAMDKWMDEFDMDSAKDDLQRKIDYLESEKKKITKVKEAIISSLQAADSLLYK
jgi:hypothetical protein